MHTLQKLRSTAIFLLCLLCLSACGGGGSGSATPTVVAGPNPTGNGSGGSSGAGASSSSSSNANTTTSDLGISFSQNGFATITVDSAGWQTVNLQNGPFQIGFPEGAFTDIYIRTAVASTGAPGTVLTRSSDESSAGWYLIAVPENDSGSKAFAYSETVQTGAQRALNIKEIRDRFTTSKTTTSPLYLQFYVPATSTNASKYEVVKVILN